MFADTRHWRFASAAFETGRTPLLMGILNVTPDSFSDGGAFLDRDAAIAQGIALVDAGADILDVGGESTRPGSEPVPEVEQLRRIEPVIRELAARVRAPISIDTTNARVAAGALAAGAAIVNDISGLTFDADMPSVCRDAGAGVVCMHIQGTPRTMQLDPRYGDVVREVSDFLAARLDRLEEQGIPRERVVLDPGIGFGKTAEHNLELLSHVRDLRELGRPVLIGHSRKRFLAKVLGRPVDERTSGTLGVSIALAMQHADILRMHDVQATRDALIAWQAIAGRACDPGS
ncbi:MAG: dihydropteroate synthase [Planctomycetaceae bacterium]